LLICCVSVLPTPRSTLFPYTTLFRSDKIFNGVFREQRFEFLIQLCSQRLVVRDDQGGALCPVDHTGDCEGLAAARDAEQTQRPTDRKSTRLNSSHGSISYAVFCLKKT